MEISMYLYDSRMQRYMEISMFLYGSRTDAKVDGNFHVPLRF